MNSVHQPFPIDDRAASSGCRACAARSTRPRCPPACAARWSSPRSRRDDRLPCAIAERRDLPAGRARQDCPSAPCLRAALYPCPAQAGRDASPRRSLDAGCAPGLRRSCCRHRCRRPSAICCRLLAAPMVVAHRGRTVGLPSLRLVASLPTHVGGLIAASAPDTLTARWMSRAGSRAHSSVAFGGRRQHAADLRDQAARRVARVGRHLVHPRQPTRRACADLGLDVLWRARPRPQPACRVTFGIARSPRPSFCAASASPARDLALQFLRRDAPLDRASSPQPARRRGRNSGARFAHAPGTRRARHPSSHRERRLRRCRADRARGSLHRPPRRVATAWIACSTSTGRLLARCQLDEVEWSDAIDQRHHRPAACDW